MEVLWARGECTVRDVVPHLKHPLAYTTVMTTLDRLFKKGLLVRRKSERAFYYKPHLARHELQEKRVKDFFELLLAGPQPSRDLLLSCLVEAVGKQDESLLDALERKIQMRRKELDQNREI